MYILVHPLLLTSDQPRQATLRLIWAATLVLELVFRNDVAQVPCSSPSPLNRKYTKYQFSQTRPILFDL